MKLAVVALILITPVVAQTRGNAAPTAKLKAELAAVIAERDALKAENAALKAANDSLAKANGELAGEKATVTKRDVEIQAAAKEVLDYGIRLDSEYRTLLGTHNSVVAEFNEYREKAEQYVRAENEYHRRLAVALALRRMPLQIEPVLFTAPQPVMPVQVPQTIQVRMNCTTRIIGQFKYTNCN